MVHSGFGRMISLQKMKGKIIQLLLFFTACTFSSGCSHEHMHIQPNTENLIFKKLKNEIATVEELNVPPNHKPHHLKPIAF